MTEILTKLIVDLSKPEGEREIIVPLTDEEIAEHQQRAQKAKEEQLALEAQIAAKNTAKESAKSKLTALGLSETEISAIIG